MSMWILFITTLVLLSLAVAVRVKSNYLRFSRKLANSGLNGSEAALQILSTTSINDVEIVPQDGLLLDHYGPLHKRLVLSCDNYFGHPVAALGVAAHEAGHAIQHAQTYWPPQWRMAAIGATSFASQIVMRLPRIGMFTRLLSTYTGLTVMAVSWDMIMAGEKADGVNKVLNVAAWTYVAAFLTSLIYFLRYLLPLLGGGRRD